MNNIDELFRELFCDPNKEKEALLYLACLMSETEDEEEYRLKESQTSRLQEFFEENPCPKKAYYLQKIKEIEDILKRDRIVNEWGIPADEESH